MEEPVGRRHGKAHPDPRRGVIGLAMGRALVGAALLAGLALLAPREGSRPPGATSADPAGRGEARASQASPVARREGAVGVEARGDVAEKLLAGGRAPARPRNRITRQANASKPTAKPVPEAASALAPRETSANERSYAQAMTRFIDSTGFADASAPLARLYFASFGRFPDQEGLDWYVGQRASGRSLESIAEEFLGSPEFDQRYGALDNATFIARLFDNVFGGEPDAAQRTYWLEQLDAGMTRGEFLLALSEGADFRTMSANEVFVATAYAEALGRTPDDAGFAYWVSVLDAGYPREAVIEGLLGTDARRSSGRTPPRGG
jgi:hypothetical protein